MGFGLYLNPSNEDFAKCLRSQIYVDKSGLIAYTNQVFLTQQCYICVSRPRRFGKTTAAAMLSAYYNRECDSGVMFEGLKISDNPTYGEHLNKYDVIYLNMQDFMSQSNNITEMISDIGNGIINDMLKVNPNLKDCVRNGKYAATLMSMFLKTRIPIVFIIDEWDCVFRESDNANDQKKYLDLLRTLLKDKKYVGLAYMTGILPIKKYNSQSALNMFDEFSMTDSGKLAQFVGFTYEETLSLCKEYQMDYYEMERWYDGYSFPEAEIIYNPKSVVTALLSGKFSNYWTKTASYEALRLYFDMNFDALKDTIIQLLAGQRKVIDIETFTNDMSTFKSCDDILTLLIHLGYLGYDFKTKETFIPNKEIRDEFVRSIKATGWNEVVNAIQASDNLLKAVWNGDSDIVARMVEQAHYETSIIKYNDENALSCVISLAFFSAREFYEIRREMPAGKGFADMSFLPRKNHPEKPAMIVELKWGKSALEAMRQIESKNYTEILKDYKGNALLVGINYDKDTKSHECMIKHY